MSMGLQYRLGYLLIKIGTDSLYIDFYALEAV
jgi:hypothetical protein